MSLIKIEANKLSLTQSCDSLKINNNLQQHEEKNYLQCDTLFIAFLELLSFFILLFFTVSSKPLKSILKDSKISIYSKTYNKKGKKMKVY